MKRDAAAQSRQLLSDFRAIMQSAEPPRRAWPRWCVWSRATWGRKSAPSTSAGPTVRWNCSRPKACDGEQSASPAWRPDCRLGRTCRRDQPARALRDARSSPAFEPRPETGEDAYTSFMGVPILYADRVLGVLVVQNISARDYHDEEQEALEMLALVFRPDDRLRRAGAAGDSHPGPWPATAARHAWPDTVSPTVSQRATPYCIRRTSRFGRPLPMTRRRN